MKILLRVIFLAITSYTCWLPLNGWSQCNGIATDTLLHETFEGGSPDTWNIPSTSDGGSWQVNSFPIGAYPNPGSGKWIYVNDERKNDIGKAQIETPTLDLTPFEGGSFLEFDLLFQEYADSSTLTIEIWDGELWQEVLFMDQDFSGRLQIELTSLNHAAIKVRWIFDDESAWAWGMGLDNVLIYGKQTTCGNEICEYGESPETCPGDCPKLKSHSPFWIPVGKDLYGKEVSYRPFLGNTACDDCAEKIDPGFEIAFFGGTHQSLFLNSNGNLTMGTAYLQYTPEAFCLNGPRMIAPFFSDVDISKGGEILYYIDPAHHYFIVTWIDVAYFGCDIPCHLTNTFQVIVKDSTIDALGNYPLPGSANVIFSYGDMNWTTGISSGGSRGLGGSAATVGINLGDGDLCDDYGTFDHNGYQYLGNSQDMGCPPNGIHHLDYRTLFMDSKSGEMVQANGEIRLNVSVREEGNQVEWTIDDISNSTYFVVQRGSDSLAFEDLEWIEASSATQPGLYAFTDTQPVVGDNFYRIWHLKETGEAYYSEVRKVQTRQPEQPDPDTGGSDWAIEQPKIFYLQSLGPNPFDSFVNIQYFSPDDQRVQAKLFNRTGRLIWERSLVTQQDENKRVLNFGNLPTGEYVLHLIHPKGKATKRLVRK